MKVARFVTAAFTVLTALATLPALAAAQLAVGVHATRAHDVLGGASGVGARLALDLPLAPVGAAINGDLFFPDCEQDCSYRGASLDVQVRLAPIPVLRPYALGSYVVRRADPGSGTVVSTDSGLAVGVGVDVRLVGLGAYLEARYEFVGSENQWVTRLGLLF